MPLYFGTDGAGEPISRSLTSLYRGLHAIGVPGSGKTTLLSAIAHSAIRECGMLVIDPEGGLAEGLLDLIPPDRAGDVLYWDPARQSARPWAGNLWREPDPDKLALNADWFQAALRSVNTGSEWGLNLDVASRVLVYALAPAGGTIYETVRFFRDRAFRMTFYDRLRSLNPPAYEWLKTYDEAAPVRNKNKLSAEQEQMAGPLIRRIEKLTTNPTLARIFGQREVAFDLGEVMAEKKILLVRLNDADLGPGVRQVLSNLLIGQLFRHCLDRQPESPPFLVVVDEVNTLIHAGWTTLIERARKHNVALCLAHQHFAHVDESVRATLMVMPNRVAFQLSGSDVKHIANSFPGSAEEIGRTLRGLPKYQALMKVDNDLDHEFAVTELNVAPGTGDKYGLREEIVRRSASIGRPKEEIDQELRSRDGTEFEIEETVRKVEPETAPLWG